MCKISPMRLLTAISIASLVVSISAVVFVLMLFVTEPWESGMKRSTEPEIHPTAVWAKFKSMAEGGRLASREVWGG